MTREIARYFGISLDARYCDARAWVESGVDHRHRTPQRTLRLRPRNRLRQFTQGSQRIGYRYDPLGRRIAKDVNGQTTWYLWDQGRLLAEYDNAGNRLQSYVYLPGDYLPAQTTKGTRTYNIHGDHLQTPRLLTDNNQHIAWCARYESFGKATVEADIDGTFIAFNFRFLGQNCDQETNLHIITLEIMIRVLDDTFSLLQLG